MIPERGRPTLLRLRSISPSRTTMTSSSIDTPRVIALMVIFYIGTIGGYLVLIPLFKMLSNMSKDKVFDRENTKIMTIITCALVGIAVDCTVCGFIWNGGWILAIVALFMSLVVLSIRVVFAKAITMKEEMDLTI